MEKNIENWEIEFDKEFPACDCKGNNMVPHFEDSKVNRNWIKAFIRQIEQRAYERGQITTIETNRWNIQQAQHQALERVLEIIDECDPSTNRKTSPAYWGNTLRNKIKKLQK